ncbi:hypothetical protein DFP72DRAFT_839947 [Ephemerocybe angulata]|uniref:Uncharacterized protein n=1 Tax=Ephemerocybe angulata TaxID=980116 RepID=A0A8H6IJE5_9AGAR|nr:hypothetical protein DFP72DRAFT_839947 [Tulosesus angulatus]
MADPPGHRTRSSPPRSDSGASTPVSTGSQHPSRPSFRLSGLQPSSRTQSVTREMYRMVAPSLPSAPCRPLNLRSKALGAKSEVDNPQHLPPSLSTGGKLRPSPPPAHPLQDADHQMASQSSPSSRYSSMAPEDGPPPTQEFFRTTAPPSEAALSGEVENLADSLCLMLESLTKSQWGPGLSPTEFQEDEDHTIRRFVPLSPPGHPEDVVGRDMGRSPGKLHKPRHLLRRRGFRSSCKGSGLALGKAGVSGVGGEPGRNRALKRDRRRFGLGPGGHMGPGAHSRRLLARGGRIRTLLRSLPHFDILRSRIRAGSALGRGFLTLGQGRGFLPLLRGALLRLDMVLLEAPASREGRVTGRLIRRVEHVVPSGPVGEEEEEEPLNTTEGLSRKQVLVEFKPDRNPGNSVPYDTVRDGVNRCLRQYDPQTCTQMLAGAVAYGGWSLTLTEVPSQIEVDHIRGYLHRKLPDAVAWVGLPSSKSFLQLPNVPFILDAKTNLRIKPEDITRASPSRCQELKEQHSL